MIKATTTRKVMDLSLYVYRLRCGKLTNISTITLRAKLHMLAPIYIFICFHQKAEHICLELQLLITFSKLIASISRCCQHQRDIGLCVHAFTTQLELELRQKQERWVDIAAGYLSNLF